MDKIISTDYQSYNPDSFYQSTTSNDSPQLLCSGEVLRYQFNPPDDRKFNNCETNPTFEGGINSVSVTLMGAVLPAVSKWLLMIGLVESNNWMRVTNSPLNDNCGEILWNT